MHRNLLITGGTGFLGRGIIRSLQRSKAPIAITVYSRDEHKQHILRSRYPWVKTLIGDVRDRDRLEAVMTGHDLVIHAAALKHVPEAERDTSQAIAVNIEGSRAVALSAIRAGVKTVVGISTDKACNPVNTYGATKMVMERIFQEAQRYSATRFANVRYGNVVSSTGSVIPLFREQIEQDGHVRLTSPKMTRFWTSIDDAVDLIFHAANDHRLGHTYVLKCPAMTVRDVAKTAWYMTGRPMAQYHEVVVGTRPGEKLHELLVSESEAPYSTEIDTNRRLIAVPPAMALTGEIDPNHIMPYESSNPLEWLVDEDMISLIEDASKV